MPASASAGAPANSRSALIGEKADLTYPYDYLGAGPETLAELAAGKAQLRRDAEEGRASADHRRRRRAGAARRRRGRGAGRQGRDRARRRQGRLERLQRAAHRGVARRRARHRLRAGRGRAQRRRDGEAGRARRAVPARRRRDRRPARRLRRLHRHPRRQRRAPRRRHPAGRGLYRRNPASTSTPKAACRWPTAPSFPPGDAREDWSILRALSDVLGAKLPYDSLPALRAALFKAHPHLAAHRPDRGRAGRPTSASSRRSAGNVDKAPFRSAIEDFYLTNPIARASAVMAECSALAEGRGAMTAAE